MWLWFSRKTKYLDIKNLKFDLQLFAPPDTGTGEKTEEATPRRRQKARERGNVAKSMDLNSAFILLVGFSVLYLAGDFMLANLKRTMSNFILQSGTLDLSFSNINRVIFLVLKDLFLIILPFISAIVVTAFAVNIFQVGFLFTLEPLKFKLNKLNPVSGLKRIFSKTAVGELVKSLIKLAILWYIPYKAIKEAYPVILRFYDLPFNNSFLTMMKMVFDLSLKIILVLIFIAFLDYRFQKYIYEESLKMSKYEVKQERKEQEGDPRIKAEFRRRMMQLAMKRMMQEVPQADVVITNPVHIACAIKYDDETMDAPHLVAKGQALIAEKIKEIAKEHNVPIVENKPLAQALYKTTEVGDPIPVELYQAVAEILAFVYRLGGKGV